MTKSTRLTFGELAWEWYEKKKETWTQNHAKTVKHRIEKWIVPLLGNKLLTEITPP